MVKLIIEGEELVDIIACGLDYKLTESYPQHIGKEASFLLEARKGDFFLTVTVKDNDEE